MLLISLTQKKNKKTARNLQPWLFWIIITNTSSNNIIVYKLPLILSRRTSFSLAFFCLLIWSQAFTAPSAISRCRVGAFSGSLMSTSPTSYCTLTEGRPVRVTSINCEIINASTVIFLQIVMVSPGTHLVKNHGSQCRTNKSQFKKQWILRDLSEVSRGEGGWEF